MKFSEIDNEKGKQSCDQSHPMEETTACHEMSNHKEGDEKDEQIEPALHPNPSFDEQEGDVQKESHPNFPYEECNKNVEFSISDVCKEDFSMPLYYECEEGYLDDAPPEATDCNNGLDHQEDGEGTKWDISLCFLNSEIIFPNSI